MGSIGLDNIIIVICAVMCSSMATTHATTMPLNLHMNLTHDLPAAQPFVDTLISNYTKTEKMLWQLIENRADNVLLRVFKTHETFFDQVLYQCGSGILARDLIPNIDTLTAIGSNVNSTTELGQSHLKEQTLDRESITEYSNSALKILKDASNLFDYATNDTLWENIITVSLNERTNSIQMNSV